MVVFCINISYSQIAVFNSLLANPFNDWKNQHVTQGFSWRPESVSFKTLIDSGPISVEVRTAETLPSPTGTRAITVPFVCSDGGTVEISSITGGQKTDIQPGSYQLLFETGLRDETDWCRFTFIPNGSMTPAILIPDQEVMQPDTFHMEAEPA